MRAKEKKKHYGIKILAFLALIFLIFVGIRDFKPDVHTVEKTLTYDQKVQ